MRKIVFLLLVMVICLCVRFSFFYQYKKSYNIGQKATFNYTFWQEPKLRYGSQVFYIDNILVRLPYLYPKYGYGDKVIVQGYLEEQSTVIKSKGQVIKTYSLKNPEIEKVDSTTYLKAAGFVRNRVIEGFNSYLPQSSASMLLGIVLGIKEGIDPNLYDKMKITGVVHVIAASGANVSILSGFLLGLFNLIVKRRLSIFFTSLMVVFYALISGFDPPIVRASIMAITAFSAQAIGRQSSSFIALSLSVFLMLFISPRLIFDVGFQLSFLSTIGILYIKPIIDNFPVVKQFILKDDFSTTIAAQAATVPIILINFASYSPLSILVNLLLLWTIPILMVLGIIAAFLCLILPIFSLPFLYLAYPLLLFFQRVVELFSKFNLSLKIESFSILLTLAYYCFLLSFVIKANSKIK